MDITKKPSELTHISLCSGYGGIDLGFKRAGLPIRTITYVEIEAFVCQNLVAKMEKGWIDVAPIWTNLKTFNWGLFNGKVDILSGGFPCQPFSQAGRRDGSEDPRHLWPYIVDGIRQLGRPPVVFFENVEGIISSKLKDGWPDPEGTSVLQHVLRELERLGYEATAGVFSAREVGAPHQRKRVFILGVNSRLNKQGRDFVSSRLHEQKQILYPAPRGVGQYSWEPKRTILGNPNGIRRGESIQQPIKQRSERIGQRSDSSWNKRKTVGESERESESSESMDNTNIQGFNGDYNKQETTNEEGRKAENGHDAKTGSLRSELHGQIEPTMGGNSDGGSCGVDISELYSRTDNRTDELRLLGNGVVPATCTRAIRVLWEKLGNPEG